MADRVWLGMRLYRSIVKNLEVLAVDNNASLELTVPNLPSKYPQRQKYYDTIFIQALSKTHEEAHFIMSWYTQASWWAKRGKECTVVIFLPPNDSPYSALLEASYAAHKHSQTIRLT